MRLSKATLLGIWERFRSRQRERLADAGLFSDPAIRDDWGSVTAAAIAGLSAGVVTLILFPDLRGVFGCGLAVLTLSIAVIDSRYFIIPDKLSLSLLVLGLVYAYLFADFSGGEAFLHAALRAAIVAATFFALAELYARLRRRAGIGMGDVKLAAGAGAWLDWMSITIAIEIAVLAAFLAVLVRYVRGDKLTAVTPIPFGLFLAPSIWVSWMFERSFLST